jgi:hypothetical protein
MAHPLAGQCAPQTTQTKLSGGLDCDLTTDRSTLQLIGRIGTSTRSTQTTVKDRSGKGHGSGSPQL